jgi:O-methyltransferase involved in polyketide biosynthesis
MAGEGRRILASFEGIRHVDRFAAGNLARHRIVDDLVVVLGAGFENRAYRLPAGTWVEMDEPQVFALKDEVLPVCECPNNLQRALGALVWRIGECDGADRRD